MRLDLETLGSFQEKLVPKGAQLAGFASLVQVLGIQAPVRQPNLLATNREKYDLIKNGVQVTRA